MTTKGDADAIRALKSAVCCSCHSIRTFIMGMLFGALLVWLSTLAGLYIARQLDATNSAPASVATPAVGCPAPVIDTPELASICMNWHHSPKQMAYKGSTKP